MQVGGTLAGSEGWARPCVGSGLWGNREERVLGRARHPSLQGTSWGGEVCKGQGYTEESPEHLLEPPFQSPEEPAKGHSRIGSVFYANRSYLEGIQQFIRSPDIHIFPLSNS